MPIWALVLISWGALAAAASLLGWFEPFSSASLLISGMVIPLAVYIALYKSSSRFRDFVVGRSLRTMTAVQASRVSGLGFLWAYERNILPGWFAVTTAITDATCGVTSLLIALFLVSRSGAPRPGFVAWHCFGIVGLATSVAM